MLKKISLVTLLVMSGAVYGQADAIAKPWEVGLSGVAIFEGGSGDALDNYFPGAGLRVGYHFTDKWSAIGEVLYTNPDYGSQKVNVVDYIGSVGYDFSPINSVIPFADLGLGYRTISDVSNRDDWNMLLGAGLKIPMYDSFQFIMEGKARWNLEKDEQGMLGTVGVNYFF
ncbi:MAG: outer membrane beta-barrel protein [Sulfurovaceae bacterium]|nr:outer membrane beta-barrel protein [Sulfurovaceae bacterium]